VSPIAGADACDEHHTCHAEDTGVLDGVHVTLVVDAHAIGFACASDALSLA
jgi:hypothetical protein